MSSPKNLSTCRATLPHPRCSDIPCRWVSGPTIRRCRHHICLIPLSVRLHPSAQPEFPQRPTAFPLLRRLPRYFSTRRGCKHQAPAFEICISQKQRCCATRWFSHSRTLKQKWPKSQIPTRIELYTHSTVGFGGTRYRFTYGPHLQSSDFADLEGEATRERRHDQPLAHGLCSMR